MSHSLASPQPPRDFLEGLRENQAYKTGATDVTSIRAHHAILGTVRRPDEQGPGWAHWLTRRGDVWLQAGMVHYEADHYRIPHPRLWIVEANGGQTAKRLIELKIDRARAHEDVASLMAAELAQVL